MSHYDDLYDYDFAKNLQLAKQRAEDRHARKLAKVDKALEIGAISSTEATLAERILELQKLGLI